MPPCWQILACPEDKGPLYYLEDEDLLYNPRLQRVYEIRDGIPVMLVDEARQVDDAEHARLQGRIDDRVASRPDVRPTPIETERRVGRSVAFRPRRADPIGASRPRPASSTHCRGEPR